MKKKMFMCFIILIFIYSITVPNVYGIANQPTIEELQKKISVLTKQVKDLTTKINTKTKENDKLKKENNSLLSQIKSKDKTIDNKEIEIDRLKSLIDEKDRIIKEKEKKIEEQKKDIKLGSAEIIYTDKNLNTGKDIKWYGFKTQHITLYFTQNAFDEFGFLIDISDELLNEVGNYFGVDTLAEPTTAYIWFQESIKNIEYGEYDPKNNIVFINGTSLNPYKKNNPENFVGGFVHEICHAFEDSLNMFGDHSGVQDDILWLTEGLATYVDHQVMEYENYNIPKEQLIIYKYDKSEYKYLINLLVKETNINLSDFTKLSTSSRHRGYEIYESIVYYIENKYGHEKTLSLLKSFKTKRVDTAFIDLLGVTEEQLIRDWKKYFELVP